MPRVIGDFLSRKWGQPVLIENHSGAGGNVGAEMTYRAAPDGYTLLSASPPPPLVTNHNLYAKLPFDPTKFEPVSVMAHVPTGLFVNPDKVKAATVAELIDYLTKNPGALTAATQGNGTTSHLTSEMFQLMAKVKLRNIPYRGSAPALQGLLAGDVDLMFDNLGVSLPLVTAGKLKLLAVASAQRVTLTCRTCRPWRNRCRDLKVGGLVRHRRAAEDAEGHRRQDQRRRQRGASSARHSRQIEEPVCRCGYGGSPGEGGQIPGPRRSASAGAM